MTRPHVLVGQRGSEVKVFGPFDNPDEARGFANDLGLAGVIDFKVLPLMSPDDVVR